MSRVFHIARREDWTAALEDGEYRISTLGRTLDEVGFIHCSTDRQVQRAADTFYRGLTDLVLITLETDRIGSPLRFDPVGNEEYPHIYGPLNVDAAIQVTPLTTGPDGRIEIPSLKGD
jgi:uncharacterized protein (DUF952 family)